MTHTQAAFDFNTDEREAHFNMTSTYMLNEAFTPENIEYVTTRGVYDPLLLRFAGNLPVPVLPLNIAIGDRQMHLLHVVVKNWATRATPREEQFCVELFFPRVSGPNVGECYSLADTVFVCCQCQRNSFCFVVLHIRCLYTQRGRYALRDAFARAGQTDAHSHHHARCRAPAFLSCPRRSVQERPFAWEVELAGPAVAPIHAQLFSRHSTS